ALRGPGSGPSREGGPPWGAGKTGKWGLGGGGRGGGFRAPGRAPARRGSPAPAARITLIESSDIGIIGVGESTVPPIRRLFSECGIDERDWMIACGASFKLAIRFVNWSGQREPDLFWHPFSPPPAVNGVPLAHYWLRRKLRGRSEPFDATCHPVIAVCEAGRTPKAEGDLPYEAQFPYAYHLDAGLLAGYLKGVAKDRGVEHV